VSHDPSEIIQIADLLLKKLLFLLLMSCYILIKTVALIKYFCENHDTFFFQDSLMNRIKKKTAFISIFLSIFFSKNINVF